jgi:hypothetical protein
MLTFTHDDNAQVNDGFYDEMDSASWWTQKSQRTMAYFFPASVASDALMAVAHTQSQFENLDMTARVTYLQIDPAEAWLFPHMAYTGEWVCVRVDVSADAWFWDLVWKWLWDDQEEEQQAAAGFTREGGEWSSALMQLEIRWNSMMDAPVVFPHLEYMFGFGYSDPHSSTSRSRSSRDYSFSSVGGIFSWSQRSSSGYYNAFSNNRPISPNTASAYWFGLQDQDPDRDFEYISSRNGGYGDQTIMDENDVLLFGYPQPFQNIGLVERLLSDDQRRGFLKYRQEQDPDAVFWGGRMSELLLVRLFKTEYSGLVPAPKSWWHRFRDFVWMLVMM